MPPRATSERISYRPNCLGPMLFVPGFERAVAAEGASPPFDGGLTIVGALFGSSSRTGMGVFGPHVGHSPVPPVPADL